MEPSRLRRCLLSFAILLCVCPGSLFAEDAESGFAVMVLGVAQDAGYPQAGCLKDCCEDAWNDSSQAKFPTGLAVIETSTNRRWLFDCTWQLPRQLNMLNQRFPRADSPGLDGIFLTHAHVGHYTGLMHLGREVMGASKVPTFCMPRMSDYLRSNGPWSQLVQLQNIVLEPMRLEPTQITKGLTVEPLLVPHRDEFSETVGFLIEVARVNSGSPAKILYLPDIDKWSRWETRIEDLVRQVDIAFLDATFFENGEIPGRDMSQIPHPFVEESILRLQVLSAQDREKVHFIHLNHTNPALDPTSNAARQIYQAGMQLAEQGQVHQF